MKLPLSRRCIRTNQLGSRWYQDQTVREPERGYLASDISLVNALGVTLFGSRLYAHLGHSFPTRDIAYEGYLYGSLALISSKADGASILIMPC